VEVINDVLFYRAADGGWRALFWLVVLRLARDGDESALGLWYDGGGFLPGARLARCVVELRVAVGDVEVGGQRDAESTGAVELADGLALVIAVDVLALDSDLKTWNIENGNKKMRS
jgi:hypothetical protein